MKLRPMALALVAIIALAQTKPETTVRPRFAVTSVKPNKTGCCFVGGVGDGGGGGKDVTLRFLIGFAYRLQQFQISGGPKWISSDHFDIEGRAEDPNTSEDQLRLMLQSLLEDRFKLKLHRESKESSVYALVVGKDLPKIKPSADQISPDVNGPAPKGAGPNRGVIRGGQGTLVGNAITLARFVRNLSPRVDRMVIDKTNLTGRFDIDLRWAPGPSEPLFDAAGNEIPSKIIDMNGVTVGADASGPSIFSAIQEQLGLKLISAKAPVDLLVIDHVEKPDTN
jgi:uncharacterized protein (TIGR03435 family)